MPITSTHTQTKITLYSTDNHNSSYHHNYTMNDKKTWFGFVSIISIFRRLYQSFYLPLFLTSKFQYFILMLWKQENKWNFSQIKFFTFKQIFFFTFSNEKLKTVNHTRTFWSKNSIAQFDQLVQTWNVLMYTEITPLTRASTAQLGKKCLAYANRIIGTKNVRKFVEIYIVI